MAFFISQRTRATESPYGMLIRGHNANQAEKELSVNHSFVFDGGVGGKKMETSKEEKDLEDRE